MCMAPSPSQTFVFVFLIIFIIIMKMSSSDYLPLLYVFGGFLAASVLLKNKNADDSLEFKDALQSQYSQPTSCGKFTCPYESDSDVDEPIDVYEETKTPSPHPETQPYPWSSNQSYSTCYQPVLSGIDFSQNCNTGAYLGIDEANSRLAALRQRDKRAIDGAVSKNANYYKRHFAKELDEAENKRWWGNQEY